MKGFFRRIFAFLHLDGRDTAVFVLSLLLASSIWLIHNLTIRYVQVMHISVIARSNLDGYAPLSSNSVEIAARCKSSGFNFVRAGWRSRAKVLDIPPELFRHQGGESFYVLTSSLQESTDAIFGENTTLDRFITDTLWFTFPNESHKKVPVRAVTDLHFAPQYMLSAPLRIEPDSVTVYAEPGRLDRIEAVETEPLRGLSLRSDHRGSLRLVVPGEARLSARKVHYFLGVSRYVELVKTVPVQVKGVPAGKTIHLMPSSVRAVMRCTLPASQRYEDELRLHVDYEDFCRSRDGRCLVLTGPLPKSILSLRLEPEVVSCVEQELLP